MQLFLASTATIQILALPTYDNHDQIQTSLRLTELPPSSIHFLQACVRYVHGVCVYAGVHEQGKAQKSSSNSNHEEFEKWMGHAVAGAC